MVASGALSSSTPASSAQLNETQAGLQAFAPEESAALATSQVDAGGTHFAAEVEGNSATIILLAQQDSSASNAIEVSNAFGKVDIEKAGWLGYRSSRCKEPTITATQDAHDAIDEPHRAFNTNQSESDGA